MKLSMQWLLTGLLVALLMPAMAQEASSVQQCFYECKLDPFGVRFAEVTTLMIANENQPPAPGDHTPTHLATLVLVDGNERVLAKARTLLSGRDLDEVNVCATLRQLTTLPAPPSAGLIQVAIQDVTDPTGLMRDGRGVTTWMKNVVGRISTSNPEVFRSRISGVGKTGCRNLPPSVVTAGRLLGDPEVLEAPALVPVLIEETEDGPDG